MCLLRGRFCPQCIYVFCVDLRTNSDYFTVQHELTGFYNRDEVRLLSGANCLSIIQVNFRLQSINNFQLFGWYTTERCWLVWTYSCVLHAAIVFQFRSLIWNTQGPCLAAFACRFLTECPLFITEFCYYSIPFQMALEYLISLTIFYKDFANSALNMLC